MNCFIYVPCLALSVGFFLTTYRLPGRRNLPCSTVDSFQEAACICRMFSIQYQHLVKSIHSSVFWKRSRRTRSAPCYPSLWSTPSTSLHGLHSSVLFKSSTNESRFGWSSNCWISRFTIPISVCFLNCRVTCTLNSVINVTAKSFLVLRSVIFSEMLAVCPRDVSDVSARNSNSVRFGGRRIFSLRD